MTLDLNDLGDAEFGVPGRKKPIQMIIIPFPGFPQMRNFSNWTSIKSPKVLVLTSCEVAMHWSLGLGTGTRFLSKTGH